MDAESRKIIIDCGSKMCRVGFSDDVLPHSVFASVVSRRKLKGITWQIDYNIGDLTRNEDVLFNYPMESGIVTNWNDMELIWRHAINHKLCVDPKEHAVLLTDSPFNIEEHREKSAEILFESLNVPAMYIASPALLSAVAVGINTGIIVSSTHGLTYTVPIYGGYILSYAIKRAGYGGKDITDYLKTILFGRGYTFTTTEIAQSIKENLCYVALDYKEEMKNFNESQKKVYNGYSIEKERLQCVEAMFEPLLMGKDTYGIHELTYNSIMSCDRSIHPELFNNIVLSGGNTLYAGMTKRLEKEMCKLSKASIKVIADSERKNLAWIGGSKLASQNCNQEFWISKKEYEEYGKLIVLEKCSYGYL